MASRVYGPYGQDLTDEVETIIDSEVGPDTDVRIPLIRFNNDHATATVLAAVWATDGVKTVDVSPYVEIPPKSALNVLGPEELFLGEGWYFTARATQTGAVSILISGVSASAA